MLKFSILVNSLFTSECLEKRSFEFKKKNHCIYRFDTVLEISLKIKQKTKQNRKNALKISKSHTM